MKLQTKKILTSTALVLGSLFSCNAANALCTTPATFGAIEFSTTTSAGTSFYITQIKAVLPTVALFYFAPTGTSFHQTLSDAQAAGQIVTVTGTAAACPTTGSVRNGGTVLAVQRFDQ